MNNILESEVVRLEPLGEQHFNALAEIAVAQPQLIQFSPSPFGSEVALQQYFDEAFAAREKGTRSPFAIFNKTTRTFAGSTSFGNYSQKDLRVEIGWTWIRTEMQGTGLNGALKHLMLHHAFNEWQIERVEFKIDSRNLRSRKAVEKLGATFEGELRSHTVMTDGFRRNTCFYSILKSEYLA